MTAQLGVVITAELRVCAAVRVGLVTLRNVVGVVRQAFTHASCPWRRQHCRTRVKIVGLHVIAQPGLVSIAEPRACVAARALTATLRCAVGVVHQITTRASCQLSWRRRSRRTYQYWQTMVQIAGFRVTARQVLVISVEPRECVAARAGKATLRCAVGVAQQTSTRASCRSDEAANISSLQGDGC